MLCFVKANVEHKHGEYRHLGKLKMYKFPVIGANINSIGRIYVMQQFISEYHRMTLQASKSILPIVRQGLYLLCKRVRQTTRAKNIGWHHTRVGRQGRDLPIIGA